MADEDAPGAVFQRELEDFASNLETLRIDCGKPAQRAISRAAPPGQTLSASAISEALNAKRLPRLDFLIALVQTLLSISSGSRPVGRDHPTVEWWRRGVDPTRKATR